MSLPTPSASAEAHSQQLVQHIQATIAQQDAGAIPFADFMQLALYTPGLGYYSGGATKFGQAGDFVTAPEISPLFSRCLAQQCQQILQQVAHGVIIEFGAGNGTMAADILQTLAERQQLPQQYCIIELSADLKERQRETLQRRVPALFSRVVWLEQLPSTPVNGIILANEVIDAMPVHLVTLFPDAVKEHYVINQGAGFAWQLGELSHPELRPPLQAIQQSLPTDVLSAGYQSELNLQQNAWLKTLSHCLQQGVILLIDYGFPQHEYYHPDRHMGTLMCHYQHRAHSNPLILPGIQDITAHVDFTALAQTAVNNELNVLGYTDQAHFLLSCGLLDQMDNTTSPAEQYELSQQIKMLTLSSEMGELCKVLALGKAWQEPLSGFSLLNKMHRL